MTPENCDPRSRIASILCKALDEAGLPWAITHGAEGYPGKVGRDFDILLPHDLHERAVAIVTEVAARYGWDSCPLPLRWAGAPVFLWKIDNGRMHNFEMHFIDRVDWAGCILADGSEYGTASVRIDGLSIATWPAFAKRLLTQILAGCWNRIEERPDEFMIRPHEYAHLEAPMAILFGRRAGSRLLELVENSNLPEIKRLSASYRARLIMRALTPGTGVRLSTTWFSGKFVRISGSAPWSAPCLFIVTNPDSSVSLDKILAQTTAQLGFGKWHVLPLKAKKWGVLRFHYKWRVRVYRALFQLVVFPFDCTNDSIRKTVKLAGYDATTTGVWVATDDGCLSVLRNIQKDLPLAAVIDGAAQADIGTRIAHTYVNHMKEIAHLRNNTMIAK